MRSAEDPQTYLPIVVMLAVGLAGCGSSELQPEDLTSSGRSTASSGESTAPAGTTAAPQQKNADADAAGIVLADCDPSGQTTIFTVDPVSGLVSPGSVFPTVGCPETNQQAEADFDTSLTRMAQSPPASADGAQHVGYVDSAGTFHNVSEESGRSRSGGFSSALTFHVCGSFDIVTGDFFFLDVSADSDHTDGIAASVDLASGQLKELGDASASPGCPTLVDGVVADGTALGGHAMPNPFRSGQETDGVSPGWTDRRHYLYFDGYDGSLRLRSTNGNEDVAQVPSTPSQAVTGVALSPERDRFALIGQQGEQVTLFLQPVSTSGEPPEPQELTDLSAAGLSPRTGNSSEGGTRLLRWQ